MGFELEGKESKAEKIRRAFRAGGGAMSYRDLAFLCRDEGIFDDIDSESFWLQGAIRAVKTAMREKDETGLPFASVVSKEGSSEEIVKQRTLWEYVDYVNVIGRRIIQERDDHRITLLIQSECRRKFGQSPSVPVLEGDPEDEAA